MFFMIILMHFLHSSIYAFSSPMTDFVGHYVGFVIKSSALDMDITGCVINMNSYVPNMTEFILIVIGCGTYI